MAGFDRLHPHLQHAIVHDLGWRSLRPVQDQTIDAVLDGCNAVVLAPTAGGKTEAAAFPVISRVLSEDIAPVCALYVCPIRALLNNIEPRIQQYASMVGLSAFKWHGDVAAYSKARFRREPAHILLTTPESIEVMLISERTDAQALFANLSVIVVDEVHAFAGDDRGAHLVSILERLRRFCGRDIQRIGLSATVGNPDEIGAWLQGSSTRPYRRVDPPRPSVERDLRVDYVESPDAAAAEAGRIARGRRSLVFVESRGQAERIAASMGGHGVDVFVHHSAVSRADREHAEAKFASAQNTAIVCTATMELGIDVGDLDQVIQIDAPGTLASLVQRMGRTGRREGTRPNCTILAQRPESLVQATALLRLLERGWVEDVAPLRGAAHVLAHQIIALSLQEHGVSRHRIAEWLAPAEGFRRLDATDVHDVVDTMCARGILHESEGLLSLGVEGEQLYGRKNFFELYAVFSTPNILRVVHDGVEIGTIQATFLQAPHDPDEGLSFRLAGRPWRVVHIDWRRGVCDVAPGTTGRVPVWIGGPLIVHGRLSEEMRAVLAARTDHSWWTDAARAAMAEVRAEYDGIADADGTVIEDDGDAVRWHTFAGGSANRLLALALTATGGGAWSPGNLSLRRRQRGTALDAREAIDRLRSLDWSEAATRAADHGDFEALSKFQRCLPERLERKLVVERVFDVDGAVAATAAPSRIVERNVPATRG